MESFASQAQTFVFRGFSPFFAAIRKALAISLLRESVSHNTLLPDFSNQASLLKRRKNILINRKRSLHQNYTT